MKKFYILALVSSFLYAEIRDEKREEFDLREQQIKVDSQILKNSWISPLSITGSLYKQTTIKKDNNAFMINLNQDIFRSGGISYAIEYAKLNQAFLLAQLGQEKLEILYQSYILDLQMKETKLQIEKQKILIENAKIDIATKEEQYQNGIIDVSYLDEAIIKLSDLENSLNSLNENLSTLNAQLMAISKDTNFNLNIKAPSLEEYLESNKIKLSKESIDIKEIIISLQRADLLPKLTISSNYEFTDNDYKVALNLTIPIDFDYEKKLETKRLDYLIEKVKLKELLIAEELNYKSFQTKLNSIEDKIKNAETTIKRYESLIERIDELYRNGMKTKDDLIIIENTKKSKKIDIDIFNIDREILILNLLKQGIALDSKR